MKQKMAHLRAMRGKGVRKIKGLEPLEEGDGFFGNLLSKGVSLAKQASNNPAVQN